MKEKKDFLTDTAKVLKRILDAERQKLPSVEEASKRLEWTPKTKAERLLRFERDRKDLLERLKKGSKNDPKT